MKCNEDVFKKGQVIAILDETKEEAERICKEMTEQTGCLHDWRYAGGRVVVKALSKLDTLLADFNARVDDVYSVAEQDLDYVAAISKTRINYIQENLNTPIYRYHETATKIRFSHLCRAKKAFVLEEFYHAANKSRGLANINQPVF